MSATQTVSEHGITWSPPPAHCELQGSEAHVWAASLDVSEGDLASFRSLLSTEEIHRAHRFRFDVHRNRFIAARALLRSILADYLETGPDRIEFQYGQHGKPSLADQTRDLQFNLAHSEDLALIAIAGAGQIGVDVERVRVLNDFDELVARFFSTRETQVFHQVPTDEQPAAFFNLWTRKEAWLKATGEGIVRSLKHVEVSFLPGEPPRFMRLPNASPSEWLLHELSPGPDFVGALAIDSKIESVHCWHWPENGGAAK